MKTDVLIIGSGLAGMAAAYEAASAGKKVTVIEKMNYFSGNSAISGGGFASWDSPLKYKEEFHVEDSAELMKADTLSSGKGFNVESMVDTFVQGAPEAVAWVIQMGVPFKETLVKLGGYSVPRSYQTSVSGKRMMDIIRQKISDMGVEIIKNCEATELIQEGGAVTGAVCRLNGEQIAISAEKGVILASGGYAADVAFRSRFCPEITDKYNCSNHRGATGEMLEAACHAGAQLMNMDKIQLFPSADPRTGAVDTWALISYSAPGFGAIYVNTDGKRFTNELLGRDAVSNAEISQNGTYTLALFDQKIAERLQISEKDIQLGTANGRAFVGQTLQELCALASLNYDNVKNAIDEHNDFLAGKQQDAFGKTASEYYSPIHSGPYYAAKQWPSVHYTMGGLITNTEAEVLDASGKPIKGLFAAGEICGCLHGANRLGGNALTECVVFGRIAGKNASR